MTVMRRMLRLVLAPLLLMALVRRWLARVLVLLVLAGFLVAMVDGFAHAQQPPRMPAKERPSAPPGDGQPPAPAPVTAPRSASACNFVPGVGMRLACRTATDGVSGAVGQVFDSSLQGLATAVADGAVWFFGKIAGILDSTTRPDLRSPWFTRQYNRMAALAWVTVLPLLLVAFVDAVVHARPADVVKSLFVYLPIAGVVTFATLQIVDLLLLATDEASAFVSRDVGTDAVAFLEGLGRVLTVTSDPTSPLFVGLIGGLFGIFGALFLWVELILRNAGINLAVLFLPLAYATMVWPRVARWASRALRTLAALILSKFFIVAVISLGAAMLSSIGGGEAPTVTGRAAAGVPTGQPGFDDVIAGSALLLLASAAPWVLWHLLAPVEGAMDAALEGSARRPTSAISPQRLSRVAALGGAAGTGVAAAPVAAAGVAQGAYSHGSHATTETLGAVGGQANGADPPTSRRPPHSDGGDAASDGSGQTTTKGESEPPIPAPDRSTAPASAARAEAAEPSQAASPSGGSNSGKPAGPPVTSRSARPARSPAPPPNAPQEVEAASPGATARPIAQPPEPADPHAADRAATPPTPRPVPPPPPPSNPPSEEPPR